jgi:hypothetical protein
MASGLRSSRRLECHRIRRTCISILQAQTHLSNVRVPNVLDRHRQYARYSSFAVIEIFAFNTFETGHPFSAASAHF